MYSLSYKLYLDMKLLFPGDCYIIKLLIIVLLFYWWLFSIVYIKFVSSLSSTVIIIVSTNSSKDAWSTWLKMEEAQFVDAFDI